MDVSNMSLSDLLSLGKEAEKAKGVDPSAARAIKEAQDLAENVKASEAVRARDRAYGAANTPKDTPAPLGITDPQLLSKLEAGPLGDSAAFAAAAKNDPSGARKMLDDTYSALSLRNSGTPAAEFRKGTQTLPDGRQIPYFTNLSGEPASSAPSKTVDNTSGGIPSNVSDLQHYNAGSSGTRGDLDTLLNSSNADNRKVAHALVNAENQLAFSPKSASVTGRQVAAGLQPYEDDLATLGLEGANAKQMSRVEKGQQTLSVAEQITRLSKDKEASVNDAAYAVQRDRVMNYAGWNGVQEALAKVDEMRKSGIGQPQHLVMLEKELRTRAKSSLDEKVQMPGAASQYLPATKQDVMRWPDKSGLHFDPADPFKPATIANTHGTTPVSDTINAAHEAAKTNLLDTVDKAPDIGAPVQTTYALATQSAPAAPAPPFMAGGAPASEAPPSGLSPTAQRMWEAARRSRAAARRNRPLSPSGVPYPESEFD